MPEDIVEGKQYIPLSQVADLTPYSEGHLILLARREKLKTVKKGEAYYTTLEWVDDYLMWLDEKLESVRGGESFELPVSSYQTEEPKLTSVMLEGAPATDSIHLETKMDSIVPQDAGLQNDVNLQSSRNLKFETPNSDVLLSMVEAEKHCDYSAAYLSLRVRQGKLRGEKQGRNWFTKISWINEYVAEHGVKESNTAPAIFSAPEPILESPLQSGGQAIINH
ncbi:MAG: hypothetical protein AAB880_00005, partial [Patescibacteria group bacterium]